MSVIEVLEQHLSDMKRALRGNSFGVNRSLLVVRIISVERELAVLRHKKRTKYDG